MNIQPSLTSTAAALAGSDRAASHQLASFAPNGTNSANSATGETVDSIDKGNASGDSGADGRQTLDTFERQKEDSDLESDENANQTPPVTAIGTGLLPGGGNHLDFKA
jgi:hypothetical protein